MVTSLSLYSKFLYGLFCFVLSRSWYSRTTICFPYSQELLHVFQHLSFYISPSFTIPAISMSILLFHCIDCLFLSPSLFSLSIFFNLVYLFLPIFLRLTMHSIQTTFPSLQNCPAFHSFTRIPCRCFIHCIDLVLSTDSYSTVHCVLLVELSDTKGPSVKVVLFSDIISILIPIVSCSPSCMFV